MKRSGRRREPEANTPSAVSASWESLLDVIDREVCRLGPRDHLRVAQLRRSQPTWTNVELRAALAALLGHKREDWEAIRRVLAGPLEITNANPLGSTNAEAPRLVVFERPREQALPPSKKFAWRRVCAVAFMITALGVWPVRLPEEPEPPPPAPPLPAAPGPHAQYDLLPLMLPAGAARPVPISTTRDVESADFAGFAAAALLFLFALRIAAAPQVSLQRRRRELEEQHRRQVQQRIAVAPARRRRLEANFVALGQRLDVPYRVERHPAISEAAVEVSAAILSRWRLDRPSETLDVAASVRATVAAGGRGVAVFERASMLREFVVLVDVESGDREHPFSAGFERLLEMWEGRRVRFTRYDFAHDPDAGLRARPRDPAIGLADLSRRSAGAPLVIFSRQPEIAAVGENSGDRHADWLSRLDGFGGCAWIDPDARALKGKDDVQHRRLEARRQELHLRGVVRFDLDDEHIVALARWLAAEGTGVQPPVRRPLPDPRNPERGAQVDEALRVWATLCALVPDPRWDQVEAIRRHFPEIHRELSHRRDAAALIEWVEQKAGSDGMGWMGHGRRLALAPALVDWLVADLGEREKDKAKEDKLEYRGRKLLLEQLDAARPDDEYLQDYWKLKRASHLIVLMPEQGRRLLDELRADGYGHEVDHIETRCRAQNAVEHWDEGGVLKAMVDRAPPHPRSSRLWRALYGEICSPRQCGRGWSLRWVRCSSPPGLQPRGLCSATVPRFRLFSPSNEPRNSRLTRERYLSSTSSTTATVRRSLRSPRARSRWGARRTRPIATTTKRSMRCG